jgi:hypothetical protein
MVSYENKQTPFLKIEKKKQKTVEKEKARERERERERERGKVNEKLIIDENRRGVRKRVKMVQISSLLALSLLLNHTSFARRCTFPFRILQCQ